MADVLIRGGGAAACCAARLLDGAGLRVVWENRERPRLPAILLGSAAQSLLAGIFEKNDLFRAAHRITHRIVAWGDAGPVTVEHSGIVVSERDLIEEYSPCGRGSDFSSIRSDTEPRLQEAVQRPFSWTIFGSHPPQSFEHAFGSRVASAAPVELCADGSACVIESLASGWLFLLPDSPDSGWLLSVGGAPEDLLSQSKLVAKRISRTGPVAGSFPASPRIFLPLGASGWLACGSAALAFDPICGDGTGNAVREAILASAVIRAALQGADAGSLVAHYEARLKLGFKRHLEICRQFYRTGGAGPWWDGEREAIETGIAWCGGNPPRFEYQLAGFELQKLRPAG